MKRLIVVISLLFLIAGGLMVKNVKAGGTWERISDPNPLQMTDFKIDPSNCNHMVITSFLGADKYSLDGGLTWNDLWFGIEPAPWNHVWSTNVFCCNGIWYISSVGTIWKTSDFLQFDKVVEFKEAGIGAFWTDGNIFLWGFGRVLIVKICASIEVWMEEKHGKI